MELEAALKDLVIANRILSCEGVVDGYGHVSIRHPTNPDHYFMSRSLAPELVTRDDLIEFRLDGTPVRPDERPLYLERFIHGAIYEARPDANAAIHSHAEDMLPFGITKVPYRTVIHSASDVGSTVPVWDIAEKFGDHTNLLVTTMDQGRDLAARLAGNAMVLMCCHGFAAASSTLPGLVRMSVYAPRNARVLLAAMRMGSGEARTLSPGEIEARRESLDMYAPAMQRGWRYWATRAGCADMLDR